MRPNEEEVLRGIQGTLLTYILPELQTEHARLELMLTIAVLGAVAGELNGAAQRLSDENAALRDLARRGAAALDGTDSEATAVADELKAIAGEIEGSLLLTDLSAAHDKLHAGIGRLGAFVEGSDAPEMRELRAAVVGLLREEVDSRALSLLGARADG